MPCRLSVVIDVMTLPKAVRAFPGLFRNHPRTSFNESVLFHGLSARTEGLISRLPLDVMGLRYLCHDLICLAICLFEISGIDVKTDH